MRTSPHAGKPVEHRMSGVTKGVLTDALADSGKHAFGGETVSKQTRVSHPIYSLLPMEVEGFDSLAELALDMHWSWNHATDKVWRQLDPALWELTQNRGLADQKSARGHGWRRRDSARAHPRIPFHLSLPGVRRIPRGRKREPVGGDGTRRQKHRRIAGASARHIPPFAPEWHRRGTVRRHLRIRSAGRTAAATSMKMNHQVGPAERFHAAFHPLPVRKACSVPQPSTLNDLPPKAD